MREVSGVRTEFEFVLPRGYVDSSGSLHRSGIMRLATAHDELQPLRDPTITGPDDRRLKILVLARVVTNLGDLDPVTPHDIEGLFAADLAYLQDFYDVVNFGTDADIDALLATQAAGPRPIPLVDAPTPAPVTAASDDADSDGPVAAPPATASPYSGPAADPQGRAAVRPGASRRGTSRT